MTLSELKVHVDDMVRAGYGEKTVVITLSQPSVGARASVGIKGIFSGFDWEHNQIRIEPTELICKRGRAKDDPAKINIFAFSYPKKFYLCPMCEERVKKDNQYCPRCGQRLIFDAEKVPSDSWKVIRKEIQNDQTHD